MKSTRNVAASTFTAIFDPKLIFQDFSNLVYQICFKVSIYCDSMNRAMSISIELAHLLFVFVLRAHFFQMSSIASFFHSFSLSLTIMFINVTTSFILTFATFQYSFFISSASVISSIFAFKKIDFVIFRFRIHFERKIIEIMLIEIFDYQIAENKNLDVCQYKNLDFQLLMKRLIKKKLLIQSNS